MSLEYDKTANNWSAYASALYLNNAVFKQQQDNIKNNESGLKLDISAFESQDKINGTECVGLLIEHWRDVASVGDEFRKFGTGVLDPTLGKMMKSINHLDDTMANTIVLNRGINARVNYASELDVKLPESEDPLYPFDNIGLYGGNQSDIGTGEIKWNKVVSNDPEIYDVVRSYPEYKNYSDREIYDLLEHISGNGCTYMALTNAIFYMYHNREEEFEKKFGFSMKGKDGDLNYRRLFLDIVFSVGFKFIFREGSNAEVVAVTSYYQAHPEELKDIKLTKKNGEPVTTPFSAYLAFKQNGIKEYPHKKLCSSADLSEMCIHYFDAKNLNYEAEKLFVDNNTNRLTGDENGELIIDYLRKGYAVLIDVKNFDLEDVEGNVVFSDSSNAARDYTSDSIDVGHEMMITGVTSEGNYEVTSWGEKYILNTKKNQQNFKVTGFTLVRPKGAVETNKEPLHVENGTKPIVPQITYPSSSILKPEMPQGDGVSGL